MTGPRDRAGGTGAALAAAFFTLAVASCTPRPHGPTPRDRAAATKVAPTRAAAAPSCELPSAIERRARAGWLLARINEKIARFEREHRTPGGLLACPERSAKRRGAVHELGDYAWGTVVAGPGAGQETAAKVQAALRCLMTFQSHAAPTDGVFSFHYDDPPSPRDNGTEFALSGVAGLLTTGASAAVRAEFEPNLAAGVRALLQHPVCPKYTNICLLQSAELLAIGAALELSADPEVRAAGTTARQAGETQLEAWQAYTAAAGIAEFGSPTYYAVDLAALLLALSAKPNALTTRRVKAGLEYLWSDLAASYFPGRESLAGPHSRTYGFFTGEGPIALAYYLEGLRATPPSPVELGSDQFSMLAEYVGIHDELYRPTAATLCIARETPRIVRAAFGEQGGAGGRQRYTYITPDFAIGSASADYGSNSQSAQDEPLRAELRSSPATPAVVVLSDYLDTPGVQVQAGNFRKVTHVLMSPAMVQSRGTVLATFRIDARDPHYAAAGGEEVAVGALATNLLVPARADELLLEGRRVTPAELPLDTGAKPTLVVRIGRALVGATVLEATGVECRGPQPTESSGARSAGPDAPSIQFKMLSTPGAAEPVARLAIYHARGQEPPASIGCAARVALVLVAEECAGQDCAQSLGQRLTALNQAAVRRFDAASGDWSVAVELPDRTRLRVQRQDEPTGKRRIACELNGEKQAFPPLEVNGSSIGMAMTPD